MKMLIWINSHVSPNFHNPRLNFKCQKVHIFEVFLDGLNDVIHWSIVGTRLPGRCVFWVPRWNAASVSQCVRNAGRRRDGSAVVVGLSDSRCPRVPPRDQWSRGPPRLHRLGLGNGSVDRSRRASSIRTRQHVLWAPPVLRAAVGQRGCDDQLMTAVDTGRLVVVKSADACVSRCSVHARR